MDELLRARAVSRCSFGRFLLGILPWVVVLIWGAYVGSLILKHGLSLTNMDNRFAFGLWIFVDLAVIALGSGAFLTGFLVYILKRHEFKSVINSAVVLGFICYSGAIALLILDVGQPLRAWFTFWHPNTHSMLTEVTFCITCYLMVLTIEYAPVVFRNRRLRQVPRFLVLEFELHRLMPVLAAIGTFLSFFHQGSLGGLYGVLRGRPFAFREGFAIWPSTFLLFVLSAAAAGPAFVLLTTRLASRITHKKLVDPRVYGLLARLSGLFLIAYVFLKGLDTLIWINRTAPASGVHPFYFYAWQPFGTWILFAEIVIFGLVPALVLVRRNTRTGDRWLVPAAILVCAGVLLNRYVMTIQTLSLPTLTFESFMVYSPSWQEVSALAGFLAYGVLLYALSFRYLSLFPKERELARARRGG